MYISQHESSTQLIPKIEYFRPYTSTQIFNNEVIAKNNFDSELALYNQSTLTILNFEIKIIPNYTWDDFLDENLELSIKFKPRKTFKIKAKIVAINKPKPKFEL
jgi:hypothetical protein